MLTNDRETNLRELLRLLEHERRFAARALREGLIDLYDRAVACAARYQAMAEALS